MSRLEWDKVGEHYYETGCDQGVIYPLTGTTYDKGEAWNGLTTVTQSPSGAEPTALWADNIKYLNIMSAEEFGGTFECYTYPDAFKECNGEKTVAPGLTIGQQNRKSFGFAYRSIKGNDTMSNAYGYKLNLIYNCLASPSEKSYATVNDSPEAGTFSFEFKTTPVNVTGSKPTSILVVESDKADPTKLATLESILYGSDGTVSYNEFTGSAFEEDVTYYERTGTVGSYVYTPTQDTSYNDQKTYYVKVITGATDPRLPLPDEVISILGESANPGQG